jgi:ABC-type nitrate/sulfonate/bicarbonate transport system ATPase subunit
MRRESTITAFGADLVFEHVSLHYGSKAVLRDLSVRIPSGSCAVLMGASGSGKTSVLKLAARLLVPTAGTVSGGGKISMQFQEPRLLPWRNAAENINAVLSDTRKTMPEAKNWLTQMGLADAACLYPDELSGGMAQRVALCRALAAPSDTVLLDEPFRGLDPATKHGIMKVVRQATCGAGRTLLLVTHAEEEADFFSDRIVYLS